MIVAIAAVIAAFFVLAIYVALFVGALIVIVLAWGVERLGWVESGATRRRRHGSAN